MSQLEEKAIAYVRARIECRTLKAQRNATRCENVDYAVEDEYGTLGEKGTHCWKVYNPSGCNGEGFERLPLSEWCNSCRERQRLHQAYLNAARLRGTTYRSLERVGRREGGRGVSDYVRWTDCPVCHGADFDWQCPVCAKVCEMEAKFERLRGQNLAKLNEIAGLLNDGKHADALEELLGVVGLVNRFVCRSCGNQQENTVGFRCKACGCGGELDIRVFVEEGEA